MRTLLLTLIILTLLISFGCGKHSSEYDSKEKGQIDSVLYHLSNEHYWMNVRLLLNELDRLQPIRELLGQTRNIWYYVYEQNTLPKVIQGSNEYIKLVNELYNIIPNEKWKYRELFDVIIKEKPNNMTIAKDNFSRLSLICMSELEQYSRSLNHNLVFDSISFQTKETDKFIQILPIFHNNFEGIRYSVNGNDTFYTRIDSILINKKIYKDSISLAIFGADADNGKYTFSKRIK